MPDAIVAARAHRGITPVCLRRPRGRSGPPDRTGPVSGGAPAPRREQRRLREEQRRKSRTRWGIIAGAAVLVLIAGGTVTAVVLNNQSASSEAGDAPATVVPAEPVVFAEDEPAAAAGAEPCTTVTVLSSLENSEMVSRLVDGYNAQPRDVDGNCVTVVATKDKSGLAAEDAGANFQQLPEDQRPTVWIPDASSWIDIARYTGGGASVPAERTSVGASDIVLAMPQALAEAIGWDQKAPTWDEVFAASEDENAWSRPRAPRVGHVQARQDEPAHRQLGRGGAARLVRLGGGVGRRPDRRPDRGRRRHRRGAPARARDEPLHGDARALPLARAPVRGCRGRSPTSSPP